MKRIITFNPFLLATGMLFGFILNPLIIPFFIKDPQYPIFFLLKLFSTIFTFLWYLGLAHFSFHETQRKHRILFVITLCSISFGLILELLELFNQFSISVFITSYFNITGFKVTLAITALIKLSLYLSLIILVRKYLYARSIWIIFIELTVPFLGVISLNNSLLKEKKELELIEQDLDQFGK